MAKDRKEFSCGEKGRYRVKIRGELGSRNYTATIEDTRTQIGWLFKRPVRRVHNLSKLLEGNPTHFEEPLITEDEKLILIIHYETGHNNKLPLDLP